VARRALSFFMSHGFESPRRVVWGRSARDRGDLDLGVRLAVTAAAGPTLLLLAEVEDLAVAILADDLGLDLGSRDHGLADLRRLGATEHQHLGEGDGGTSRTLELLHAEDVALCHPVLLAARANHCVHRLTP